MNTLTRRTSLGLGLAAFASPLAAPAHAQRPTWPTKPVSLVVAFAPGGAADVIARILAQKLSEQIGQSVVIENRVGGGGTVSAAYVARSTPDAQTVLLLTSSHAVNETLARNRGYDLVRDMTPVVQFAATPYWLFVPPDRPATLAALLERAKAQPMTFASGGPGGLTHLLGEMLAQTTGLRLTHVPYRGNAPAVNDLMAGRVDMLFDNTGTVLEQVRDGKLRVLASTSAKRLSQTPDVPTMVELGYPAFDVSAWLGLGVPAATDPAIVQRLQDEVIKALDDKSVRDRLVSVGAEPAVRNSADFQALVKSEIPRWAAVIKAGNITAD
jgi:tripartite-type tricarboxylate transporter receptor subunit TctC